MKPALQDICFRENETIQDTLRMMTKVSLGFAIAVDDDGRLVGILTDGDLRRAFLIGKSLHSLVRDIINRSPKAYPIGFSLEHYRRLMLQDRKAIAPLVDLENRVVDYISLDQILATSSAAPAVQVPRPKGGVRETVLVTGGAGYIGSILCRKLVNAGYHVRILDTLVFGDQAIQELLSHPHLEFIKGDVRHIETLDRAVFGVDRVIHLAAIVGDPACALESTTTITNNYFGTKVLAEIARSYHVKQFVFASSCSVYGANGDDFLDEASPVQPLSLYAETRLQSEHSILDLEGNGFCPTILRLATVYGLSPRMRFDLVVNLLAAQAVTRGQIAIIGPNQWRPFVHVEDVAQAFVRVIQVPLRQVAGHAFNVGCSVENYTIRSLGKLIQDIIPGTQLTIHDGSADLRSYRVSCDKIAKEVGFHPEHTVSQGVWEIKTALESRHFTDYLDAQYSNFKTMERVVFQTADLE